MTIVTEEQAKLKLCPFINGSCKTSDCMKWIVAEDGWLYANELFKSAGWESCPQDSDVPALYRRRSGKPPRGYCGAGS